MGMALDHWQLVNQIADDQTEAIREIKRLEKKIAELTRFHYNAGLAALKKNRPTTARNHFLTALRLDPTFRPALKQIKARFSPFPLIVYLSANGDRPASIAKNVLGDESKAFLVAWFNDLPEEEALAPGTLLILPKLKKTPPEKINAKQAPDRLAAAHARLEEDDLDGALAMANQADTSNPDVQAMVAHIHLLKAEQQIESELLEDARQSLARVPDGLAGKARVTEKLTDALHQQQFSRDLAAARIHFDRGEYRQSRDQADALLESDPDNPRARDLATEARYRLALEHFDHKRYLEGREELEKIQDDHEASAALKATIRERLVEQAQIHYRNGVKHYINEDLQSAISDWEMALVCDPDHHKARENIQNARRIMQKIETMP